MAGIWIKKQEGGTIGVYTKFYISDSLFMSDYVSVNGITPQGEEEILGEYKSEKAADLVLYGIERFINNGKTEVYNMPELDAYMSI